MTEQDKLQFAEALAERYAQLARQVVSQTGDGAVVEEKLADIEKAVNDFSDDLRELVQEKICLLSV